MLQKQIALVFLFTSIFIVGIAQTSYLDSIPIEQDIFSLIQDNTYGGEMNIYQNPSLHVLIDKNTRLNEKEGLMGYRIQIYSGSGNKAREISNEVRLRFLEVFPEFDANLVYFNYQAPYFRVRVGDFRNKNEAYEKMAQIKKEFPGSYMVLSKINFPKLELAEYK